LAGRNTIDLYMANQRENELVGAPTNRSKSAMGRSAGKSAPPTIAPGYKHIKRMVLELQGQNREAAALQ